MARKQTGTAVLKEIGENIKFNEGLKLTIYESEKSMVEYLQVFLVTENTTAKEKEKAKKILEFLEKQAIKL